jgi:anaerobic magnesium-protoporphyrin IX monomethyl ester cyclase
LEFAKSLRLDTAQFFPIIVYPGTTAYSWAKDKGYLLCEDFSQWNSEDGSYNCLLTRPGLKNDDLVEFCDKARRAFYLRPKYLLYRLKRLFTHPIQDGPRILKSFKIFAKNL